MKRKNKKQPQIKGGKVTGIKYYEVMREKKKNMSEIEIVTQTEDSPSRKK